MVAQPGAALPDFLPRTLLDGPWGSPALTSVPQGRDVVVCETAAQVQAAPAGALIVAATAHACINGDGVLSFTARDQVSLEDLYDPRALWLADEPLLAWQGEWSDRVDSLARELVPALRAHGFRPAGLYLFFLKILSDMLYRSAFALAHLMVVARPASVHVFDPGRDRVSDELFLGPFPWNRALPHVARAYGVPVSSLPAAPDEPDASLRERLPGPVESLARRAKRNGARLRPPAGVAGEVIHGAGYDLDAAVAAWAGPARALHEVVSPWALLPDHARLAPSLARAWRGRLSEDPLLREPFEWAGVDLTPLALPQMRRWWLSVVPRMHAALGAARSSAARARPAALLLSSPWSPEDHGVMQGLRSGGVPTATFQHGGFEGNCEYTTYDRIDLRLADHRFVYGEATARYFGKRAERSAAASGEPRADSIAVGSPRLDRLRGGGADRTTLRAELGVGDDEKLVLYLPASYARNWYACRGSYQPVAYLRLLQRVMAELRGIDGLRVLYKPFPETPPDPMIAAIELQSGSNVGVYSGERRAPELFKAADVVVMDIPSTALLEALVDPVPLIVHADARYIALRDEARPLLARRVALSETPDEFLEQLRTRLAPGGGFDDLDLHDETFLREYGTHEGDGAEHAASELRRIARLDSSAVAGASTQQAERLVTLPDFHSVGEANIPLVPGQEAAVADMNARLARGELAVETVPCLCGSSDFAEVGTADRYGLAQETVICRSCGLVQSNPRLTPDGYRAFYESDLYRRIYDGPDFLERYEENYRDGRGEAVLEWVRSQRPLGEIGSLVEFGAGGGWNLVPFVREGVNVRGYDLSNELIPLAASHGVEIRQGGLEAIEGSHDALLLLHVLEHLLDPVDAMRTLAARLKPDGLFFIEVPDIESFAVGQLQNAHTYYFSERTLRHYAAEAGLRAESFEHVASTGHMRGVFVHEKTGSDPVVALDGHYEEMAAMMRRYNREWRLRAPVRGATRVLRRAGLEQRARKLLGR